ncbi:MAG: sulfotransferase domain-containing protein [Thiobacillus sp.]|nr:sulfotransferase domain-containing protein [Thiobacillus sp.]
MRKKLFLHIGLPKTGTTFLQCQLEFNRDKLRSNGIYVPKIGQLVGRDHNLLALALQPERWDQFPADISARLPSLWHDLLEEIDNCGYQTILVTSETFSWELKTQEQIKSVRDYLVNYDVKIVLCERNPYDFISSMYGHLIRTGRGPYPLDSFLLEFPYYWSAAFQKKRWGEFFGDDNFILLSYENIKGEFILHKFLNALFPGHAILSEIFDASPDVDPNLSLSPRFLRFMEELSANRIDGAPYVNLYSEVLNTLVPLERQMLSPADIDEAMKRCGMVFDSSNSTASKMSHPREQAGLSLEQMGKDLQDRTQELVDTRRTLVERTERLEQASKDLLERTQELVETRQALLERTAELVDTRQILAERTERLEQVSKTRRIDCTMPKKK